MQGECWPLQSWTSTGRSGQKRLLNVDGKRKSKENEKFANKLIILTGKCPQGSLYPWEMVSLGNLAPWEMGSFGTGYSEGQFLWQMNTLKSQCQ